MITIDPPSTPSIARPATAKSPSGRSKAGAKNAAPAASPLSKSGLTRFLNRAREAVDLVGEVEVLLTSDAELKRLNRTFRGKNKATDVLSFPGFTPEDLPPGFPMESTHAGDLAISLETAQRQADAFGHSLRDEVRILLLHGLLHLSGLDHETDSGEMAAREAELRAELRLPTSLIARVSAPSPRKAKPASKRASLRRRRA